MNGGGDGGNCGKSGERVMVEFWCGGIGGSW